MLCLLDHKTQLCRIGTGRWQSLMVRWIVGWQPLDLSYVTKCQRSLVQADAIDLLGARRIDGVDR